ncbi:MAG: capsular polysaccharide synthesis protein [Paludibacter sp.]|jgi:hypothetical protein|nr:capsular polysaccharide synthesis protein [Paludibacter sp.]
MKEIFLRFKINRIVRKQAKTANYLNSNYIQPYFENRAKRWLIAPKQNLETEKIVWQFWFQGIDENLPPLVRVCFASVDKYMSDYKIIRLTKDNISDYVDLPDFALQKIGKRQSKINKTDFKMAHFSDLLRVCLLEVYGGVWLDAKILLTGKIDETILNSNFFMFQRTEKPPKDEKIWINHYAKYFSWRADFKVRSLNSFIVGKKGNALLNIMQDMLLNYWENETEVKHYFWFQILFHEIINRNDCKSLNCKITNDIDPHRMLVAIKQDWTLEKWNEICKASQIHKLRFVKNYSKNSFYSKIIQILK